MFRADKERILREKVRLHAEHMRDRRSQPADNPADDMRSAQRELEVVSVSLLLAVWKLYSNFSVLFVLRGSAL